MVKKLRAWLIHALGGLTELEAQDEGSRQFQRHIGEVHRTIEEHVRSELPESGRVEEHNRGFLRACREIFEELELDRYRSAAEPLGGFQTYSINGKRLGPGRTGRLSFNATRHGP